MTVYTYQDFEPITYADSRGEEHAYMHTRAGSHTFAINIGGGDYYASEVDLDKEQAKELRRRLNEWLMGE